MNLERKLLAVVITLLIIIIGCSGSRIERTVIPPEKYSELPSNEKSPFIKLHTKDGGVYILNNWSVNPELKTVNGKGKYLNSNREVVKEDTMTIPFSDVILMEANDIKSSAGFSVLTGITIMSVAATVVCISNFKACFGSCPTFYADNGNGFEIQAEAFSSSISPSMEATDIDALYNLQPNSKVLQLRLNNEAYETHVIRSADIIAVPRLNDTRVFSSPDGKYFSAFNIKNATGATGDEGDISQKVCSFDGDERFSSADSSDLSEKEIIELTFAGISNGKKGLILGSRQTLLTTYFFYQTLAFMGTSAGEWIAQLERSDDLKKKVKHPGSLLGLIEVQLQDSTGRWITIGETGETGPIAKDIKIIPIDCRPSEELKIRLRMTKGLWRIDYAALADIREELSPVIIHPSESYPAEKRGCDVITALNDPDSALITLPGDEFLLHYELPDNYNAYEYFLQGKGYYIEWMREEWLPEENQAKVIQLLTNPKQYLKDLAPGFKEIEASMERVFWESKYVNP